MYIILGSYGCSSRATCALAGRARRELLLMRVQLSCLLCVALFFLAGCLADGRPSLQPPSGLQLSSPPAVPLMVFSIRGSAEIMLIWVDTSPHSVGLLPQTNGLCGVAATDGSCVFLGICTGYAADPIAGDCLLSPSAF